MRLRRILTASALTLLFFASTPVAAAEPATVAGTCSATVDGQPGQLVALDPAAVVDPISRALGPLDPLGLLTSAFPAQWAARGPIPLGTVPDGQLWISGTAVADAVTARLGQIPLLGPVLQVLTPAVHQTLSSLCGVLVRGVQPKPAPPQSVPGAPAQPAAPASPAGAGSPAGGAPPAPAPAAGPAPTDTVVFGSRLPDGALFPLTVDGVPGDAAPGMAAPVEGMPPIAVVSAPLSAGSAAALEQTRDPLPVTTLVALLSLSLVSAFLVRRWVLGGHR